MWRQEPATLRDQGAMIDLPVYCRCMCYAGCVSDGQEVGVEDLLEAFVSESVEMIPVVNLVHNMRMSIVPAPSVHVAPNIC